MNSSNRESSNESKLDVLAVPKVLVGASISNASLIYRFDLAVFLGRVNELSVQPFFARAMLSKNAKKIQMGHLK